MTAAELAMLAIGHPVAGMVAAVLFVRCQVHTGRWQRQQREDRHYADVRAWREIPDDMTRELRPVSVVRRESLPVALIERAEAAGRAAEARVKAAQSATPGRHRADEHSDALMRALVTKTQAMFVHALTAAGEQAPSSFGPREPMMRRIVWDVDVDWQQPELEVS